MQRLLLGTFTVCRIRIIRPGKLFRRLEYEQSTHGTVVVLALEQTVWLGPFLHVVPADLWATQFIQPPSQAPCLALPAP